MIILPVWFVVVGLPIYLGLSQFLSQGLSSVFAFAATLLFGLIVFLWREGAFDKRLTPEELAQFERAKAWRDGRAGHQAQLEPLLNPSASEWFAQHQARVAQQNERLENLGKRPL